MPVKPQTALSLAAMVVAVSVGVAAQGNSNSATNAGATSGASRVLAPMVTHDAPLADAARRQDKQAILSLLAKKADVNAIQPDGATALHWAVYAEDAELTGALIRAGANVNVRNNYGVSPLAIAAKHANPNILGQLMKAGADPNDKINFINADETPLMHAARAGNVDAVNMLLLAGAQVNARESWNGQSALQWAAPEGRGSQRRRRIDRSVGAGLEGSPHQNHPEDAVVSRATARCRHRRGERHEQQLGTAAAGGYPRGELARQRRVHRRQHRSHARNQVAHQARR